MNVRSVTCAAASRGDAVFVLAADGRIDAGDALQPCLRAAKATGDLRTSFRAVNVFHQPKGSRCKRLGVVGMGKAAEVRTEELDVTAFSLVVPANLVRKSKPFAAGMAVAEGLVLGAYRYAAPSKQKPKKRAAHKCAVAAVGLSGADEKEFARGLKLGAIAAQGTVFARDLENEAPNILTPAAMARHAKRLAGGRLAVKVLDEKQMDKLGMGSLLGVSRGSAQPAKLIVFEYKTPGAKGNVAVIGKGLTFDSGGISIKPSARMDEMRYDMCGGGAVMGLFHALSEGALGTYKPKKNIIGVIAAVENMPDADAQRPGDVVTAMDGQTIEVLNTDAEGRLVLADAICYARKFYKPELMCDLATLTGAVVVALGTRWPASWAPTRS